MCPSVLLNFYAHLIPNSRYYVLGIENDESIPAIVVADMTTKVSDVIVSDGGNVLGLCNFASAAEGGEGFADNFASDVIIAGYDNYAAANTPYAVFGRTGLQDKGGLSKVLVPKELTRYYNKSDFAGLVVSEYKCPVEVDDQVDQRNVARPTVMAVGAYDADEGVDGVAEAVAEDARGLAVTALGGGMYRLSTEAGDIAVYDLSGRAVAHGYGDVINLSGLTGGVYVIVADGAACKIVK